MTHESLYGRFEPTLVLVVAMVVLIILGVMAAETDADAQALLFAGVAVGLLSMLILPFMVTRRRWEVAEGGLIVRKGLWFMPRILAKSALIPWDEIARVERLWLGLREAVRIVGAAGSTMMIVSPDAPIVREIRARSGSLPLTEAAGPWSGPFGLGLLAAATVASGFVAAAAALMVIDGDLPTGTSGNKGVVLGLFLPFLSGYGLFLAARRAWRVRAANRQALP